MRKKTLIGLVALMCISLLGIITVQFFWVNNAVNVQTQKFNATVYDALNQTVYKLQRDQAANYFLNRFAPNANRSTSLDTTKKSSSYTIPYFPNTSSFSMKPYDGTNKIKVFGKSPSGTFSAEVKIYKNGVSSQYSISHKNLDFNDPNSVKEIENIVNHLNDSINNVIKHIHNGSLNAMTLLNQFNYELHMQRSDKHTVVNKQQLRKALTYALKTRGVNLNCEFGIFDKRNAKKPAIATKKYNAEETSLQYSCLLFPDNLIQGYNNYVLDVYFPQKNSFIMKSLSLLLLSSILLTLFIIATFYFTFRTIINQKKVSDIKSDFINNMTHELKTPIATINLAADNIANPIILNKPEHISPFIHIIKEENQRMNKQVERVLQMSLLEKKDFQLMPMSIDVHILINDAVNKIALMVNEKKGTISSNLKANFTICELDEVHFTNVLLNLFENAIKYAKNTPSIEVSSVNVKNGIEIRVRDKGIGMSKEQQAKAFDKFFRATKGNIHNIKGFGLGLSYVKAIMIQHKGDISVKSRLGEGSEFKLFLPQLRKV